MPVSTIVGEEQIAQVNQALKDLDTADREIRLAERAGIDVTEARKQAADSREKLLRIKQTYGVGS